VSRGGGGQHGVGGAAWGWAGQQGVGGIAWGWAGQHGVDGAAWGPGGHSGAACGQQGMPAAWGGWGSMGVVVGKHYPRFFRTNSVLTKVILRGYLFSLASCIMRFFGTAA